MKTSSLLHRHIVRFTMAISTITAVSTSSAGDLAATKFFGKWTNPNPISFGANLQIAASEKWIVAGYPESEEQGVFQGALQVFNAVTGAWVRRILPPTGPNDGPYFGGSVAISGDLAVAGAPYIGRAYVISIVTGKVLRTLIPEDPNMNGMGHSLAISGSRVIIGSAGLNAGQGAAYIFDLNTGLQLAKLTASDGAGGHRFGTDVAAEGNVAIVTATGVNASRGAGYLFDLTTFAQISKLQPTASVAGDNVGWSVAMHQGKVVLGAPKANADRGRLFVIDLHDGSQRTLNASDGPANDLFGQTLSLQHGLLIAGCANKNSFRGAVYAFDLHSAASTEFDQLAPPDSYSGAFGYSVALCGNTVFATAPLDDTQTGHAGAFWRLRSLTKPMPLSKVAAKGDSAHGAVNISYNTFGDAFLNSSSECVIASSLSGTGSNANKDVGVWSTLGASNSLDLVAKSRDVIDLGTITSVTRPLVNSPMTAIFKATIAGPGITSLDNQAIYSEDGISATRLVRTGEDLAAFNLARASSFPIIVQSLLGSNRLAISCVLRQGIASTSATNDTGVLWYNLTNQTSEAVREGSPANVDFLSYGQFSGRVACFDTEMLYSAANTDAAAFNQTLFQKAVGQNPVVIARKGIAAPAALGANFSAFIGETADDSETALYRASLTGGTTTAATNEGLWTRTKANVNTLVFRKGDTVPGAGGATIAKFIYFWEAYEQPMALVQLTGTGVTTANDQALLLYQTTTNAQGVTLLLMREGDPAPGCVPAKIGTISRVEVEPYGGHYFVLATLAGAPVGTELALFRGFSHMTLANASEQTLRRPVLALRKGILYDNQPSRVKSIALPTTNITASGAGGVGLGRAIQETANQSAKDVIVTVTFDSGVVQVMKGTP